MALPKNLPLDRRGPGGIPFTFGKYYFVNSDAGSDGNNGLHAETPFLTIAKAYAQVTSGNHDVIVLSGNGAHAQTSMLDFSKSRFHMISAGCRDGSFGSGAASRVTIGVTTAATDIAVMQNTGVRNTFTGIKFDSANEVAEGLYAVAEGGEYTIYTGCEFYKSTDLDVTGAAEFLHNGDSTQFKKCVFGSTANIVADNVIRPNILLTATLAGKKCRDSVIDECVFLVKAAGTEAVRIYGANATDVERYLLIKNCTFISNALGAATPAHAIGLGATQTEGSVLVQDCHSIDHTVTCEAGVGIYVSSSGVPVFATSGVAVTA